MAVLIRLAKRLGPFRRTLSTTGGLVAASVVTSGTGFVFWWMAARAFPEGAVGLAGAAVSAMLFLSQVAVFGLGTTLVGVLHREPQRASLILTALVTASVAGVALGLGFGLVAPFVSRELAPIGSTPLALAVFAAGVGFSAMASVLDQILVAVARNLLQLLRNSVFAFARLLLLAAAAMLLAPEGMAIYAVWLVGILVSLAPLLGLLRVRRVTSGLPPLVWGRLRQLATGALTHHVLSLSRSSSIWLLPVLVTVLLSSEANASFYVALLLANFIALMTVAATFTLYVAGAQEPELLWRQVRFTLSLTVLAAAGGTLVLTLMGRPLLGVFGGTYADAAYPTVAYLALGTLPLVVKDHWIVIQRVHGNLPRAAAIGVGTLVVELVAAGVGARLAGLEGLALARLVVLTVQAAFMWPAVYRALQPPAVPSAEGAAG